MTTYYGSDSKACVENVVVKVPFVFLHFANTDRSALHFVHF